MSTELTGLATLSIGLLSGVIGIVLATRSRRSGRGTKTRLAILFFALGIGLVLLGIYLLSLPKPIASRPGIGGL